LGKIIIQEQVGVGVTDNILGKIIIEEQVWVWIIVSVWVK
jgi:hypothetical protein